MKRIGFIGNVSVIQLNIYNFRWMNKMGLAAIAYDEKKLTEHAIFPSIRRHQGGKFT